MASGLVPTAYRLSLISFSLLFPSDLANHSPENLDVAFGQAGAAEEAAQVEHNVFRVVGVEVPDFKEDLLEVMKQRFLPGEGCPLGLLGCVPLAGGTHGMLRAGSWPGSS